MSSGWSEPSAIHHGGYQEQYDRMPHSNLVQLLYPSLFQTALLFLPGGSRLSAGTTCRQEREGEEIGKVKEDHDIPPFTPPWSQDPSDPQVSKVLGSSMSSG